jgi:5-methylcytosine-specific restriction endonuclease McrA
VCDVSHPSCGICDVCRSKSRSGRRSRAKARQKANDRLRKKAHKKKKQIIKLYGKWCYICHDKIGNTIDHVIPISKGGTNDISNLRPACYQCNYEKGDKIYDL